MSDVIEVRTTIRGRVVTEVHSMSNIKVYISEDGSEYGKSQLFFVEDGHIISTLNIVTNVDGVESFVDELIFR